MTPATRNATAERPQEARSYAAKKTTDANGAGTIGFGVPINPATGNTEGVHHLIITDSKAGAVFTMQGLGYADGVHGHIMDEYARLSREEWFAIRQPLQNTFNKRLKDHGLAKSRFSRGDNAVDRLLAKEALVLALAIRGAPSDRYRRIIRNWTCYRPEELWWLFSKMTRPRLNPGDSLFNNGWVKAVKVALSEG